jgi:hypothetical protein
LISISNYQRFVLACNKLIPSWLEKRVKIKTMKKTFLSLCIAGGMFSAAAPNLYAVPITGVIGFSGTAQLDGPTVDTSSEVLSWSGNNVTGIASGSFAGLSGSPVALASPWFFNSGVLNNFWVVNGFTFDLTSSHIYSSSSKSISVILTGTVVSTIAGLDPTSFIGDFTVQDPSASQNGNYFYTESISFGAVPDGGTTVLLMGISALALGAVKYKWGGTWA